ncbi:hypothetical protein N9L68_04460 [bacterium]|nr:hypothetical protein [bacterium]
MTLKWERLREGPAVGALKYAAEEMKGESESPQPRWALQHAAASGERSRDNSK